MPQKSIPITQNSEDHLLDLFPDNNTQEIEAKDIRELISTIYEEMVLKYEDVIDSLDSTEIGIPLSANQGRYLNEIKENILPVPSLDGMMLIGDRDGSKYWEKAIKFLSDLNDVSDDKPKNYDILTYIDGIWTPHTSQAGATGFERGGIAWVDYRQYAKGDVVTESDEIYVALENVSPGHPPSHYPGGWKKTSQVYELNDLLDVDTQNPRDGNYLRSNSSGFMTFSNFDEDVTDTIALSLIEGNGIEISYDSYSGKNKISLDAELNDIKDVDVTNESIGDILVFNGNEWKPSNLLDTLDKGGTIWKQGVLYERGDIVSYNLQLYICSFGSINEPPNTSGKWQPYSLNNLSDVDIINPNDLDLIHFNLTTGKWEKIGSTITGGSGQENKIPMLNTNGKLDPSMLDVVMFHRIDSHDPTITEYPDTTGHTLGAFWDILFTDGVTTEYTYTTGDLVGKTVKTGDFIIWSIGGWSIMPAIMNPLQYYKRDGTQPLTADLQAGGYKLSNIKNGVNNSDAVTIEQHNTKENFLGYPSTSGYVLSSDTQGNRNWIEMSGGDPGTIYHDQLQHLDYPDQHPIETTIGLRGELDNRYTKQDFIQESTGSQDAGKPIVLGSNGKIHTSMLDSSTFYYVGPWNPSKCSDPSTGCEYPDTTGESPGAFWVIQGMPIPYTFMDGDLQGKTVDNGDFIIWGDSGWSIMVGEMNPMLYYKLDGTQSITADFAGGGHRLTNIANGVVDSDGVNVYQHNLHINNKNNPHNVTKDQIGLENVENLTPADMPISDDTQNALDGKENWLQNPTISGQVLSSDVNGNRSWIDSVTAVSWGGISGDINNQTDLIDKFNNYVLKSGDVITGDLIVKQLLTANTLKLEYDTNDYFSKIMFSNVSGGNSTPMIYWDNIKRQFRVTDYTIGEDYLLWHSGTFNPDTKVSKAGDSMSGNLTLPGDPSNDYHAIHKKYVDDAIDAISIPDAMLKSVYDTNDNGIVDDSEKLGGQLPTFYATQDDLNTKVSKSGDDIEYLNVNTDLNVTGESFSNVFYVGFNPMLNGDSRIKFSDTDITTHPPSIFWNSNAKMFMLDTTTNSNYIIYHSGNLNPSQVNPITRRKYIGDGVETRFEVPEGYTPYNIDVYYNGVKLFNDEDIDVSSGTHIDFIEAPHSGDRIDIIAHKSRVLGDNPHMPLVNEF